MNVYSKQVLVDNWFEENILHEDRLKDFITRRQNGQLLSQTKASANTVLLKQATLSCSPDGFVHFGDFAVIANAGSNPDENCTEINGLSLAFGQEDKAVAIAGRSPYVRNTWVIFPTDGSKPGDVLRYNQPFAIATHPEVSDTPWFLQSDFSGLQNTKKSRTQPLGFTQEGNFGATWKVLSFDPQLRMEHEGMPVRAGERCIIVHQKTNNNLTYLENFTVATPFGKGQEMTARTELNSHNAEQPTNHWKFVLK
jgi:hypothetical protein